MPALTQRREKTLQKVEMIAEVLRKDPDITFSELSKKTGIPIGSLSGLKKRIAHRIPVNTMETDRARPVNRKRRSKIRARQRASAPATIRPEKKSEEPSFNQVIAMGILQLLNVDTN